LHQNAQHDTVLIHCRHRSCSSPLMRMKTSLRSRYSRGAAFADAVAGQVSAKLPAPVSDAFVGDLDAALSQNQHDVTQAGAKEDTATRGHRCRILQSPRTRNIVVSVTGPMSRYSALLLRALLLMAAISCCRWVVTHRAIRESLRAICATSDGLSQLASLAVNAPPRRPIHQFQWQSVSASRWRAAGCLARVLALIN
jgi:hypothetical protein